MFHDAPVSRFAVHAEALHIETEEFSFSPTEILPSARIIVAMPQGIYRNDVRVAAFQIESADAQIFGLEGSLGGVRLHLIWRFWNPRAPEVWCTYWFPGATRHAEALTGGPLVPVCTPPDPN